MTDQYGRDPRVDKHEQILDKLVEQQIRIEEMLKVQIRRADIQEEALKKKSENDATKEVELAKTLATIGQSMTILKWVAGVIGGTLLLNVAQHFMPK
jgi:hypothetical protein